MPLKITYTCQDCTARIRVVYDEQEGASLSGPIGCPGQGCMNIHKLDIREIDEEEAQQLKSEKPFML